jgi:hypothetical protein
MCTVAETVQESLWKSPHPSPPPLQPVVVGLSKPPIPPLLLRPWQAAWLVGPISLFQDHPLPLISFTLVKGKKTFWFSSGFDYCKL